MTRPLIALVVFIVIATVFYRANDMFGLAFALIMLTSIAVDLWLKIKERMHDAG